VLAAEWVLALAGILAVTRGRRGAGCSTRVRVALYLCMGWLALFLLVPIVAALPPAALAWLLAGGAAYTVGAAIFVTQRPRLWPGRFGSHDLWHCLVLIGSACHFVLIWAFVA
jgi:hemolysin III